MRERGGAYKEKRVVIYIWSEWINDECGQRWRMSRAFARVADQKLCMYINYDQLCAKTDACVVLATAS